MTTLEKYRPGGKNRFTCPGCGKPKSFVRYIDENGHYLANHVGRCNRETSCSYHFTPKQYYADNPQGLGEHAEKCENFRKKIMIRLETVPILQVQTLPNKLLTESLKRSGCNFMRFLAATFGDEQAQALRQQFRIGSNSDQYQGATVFWYLDELGSPHAGQVMQYDPETGRRQKTTWIHSILAKRYETQGQALPTWLKEYQDQAAKFPFPFGLHLLNENPGKPCAIVESAKTAIIMTAKQPAAVWLAIGAKGFLSAERLERLQDRDIILYPDLGAYEDWKAKAAELKAQGFKIQCSDLLECRAQGEDRSQGYDIADYFLAQQAASKQAQGTAQAETQDQPELAPRLGHIQGLPNWLTLHPDGIHVKDIPLEILSGSQRQRFHTYIIDGMGQNSMLRRVWDFYWPDIVA